MSEKDIGSTDFFNLRFDLEDMRNTHSNVEFNGFIDKYASILCNYPPEYNQELLDHIVDSLVYFASLRDGKEELTQNDLDRIHYQNERVAGSELQRMCRNIVKYI